MILLLFALSRLQATGAAQDDDFSAPFSGSLCGAGSIRHEPLHSDLMVVEEPKFKFMAAHPKAYKPYRILFVYDQDISPATKRLIEKAAKSANARLGRAVKSSVLIDVRLPQIYNKTRKSCDRPKCKNYADKFIPYEYVQPCRDPNGKIIVTGEDRTTEEPSSKIAELSAEGYSATVFVYVHGEGANISSCLTSPFTAVADYCREDSISNRPTYGVVFWCKPPSALSETETGHLMLHQLLHIVTAVNLIGIGAPRTGCVRNDSFNRDDDTHESLFPKSCKKKTWDTMEIPRMVNNLKTTPFTAYLSLTPHVRDVVREHFNCSSLAGAELLWEKNSANVYYPSSKHWSYRLFSDDILSKYINPYSRLSALTLAAIKDTNWYEVDLSKAEPLMYSRPKEDGCKMATEHCDKILADTRAKKSNLNFIAPYCLDTNSMEILSPLCSKDGSMMLSCEKTEATNDCPVIIGIINQNAKKNFNYDTMACEEATTQPTNIDDIGGQVGPDTMCAVFASIPKWPDKARKRQMRFCVKRKCREGAVVLYLTPQGAICVFVCKKALSNRIIDFRQETKKCRNALGDQVSLMCPDFDAVCPSKPTTPTKFDAYNTYKRCLRSSGPAYKDENDFVPEPYVAPDPKWFVPYKILFLYDPRISNGGSDLLLNVSEALNKRLATFLSAPRLLEVRRARKWNENIGKCNVATCRGLTVPSSYVLPCLHNLKQPLAEYDLKAKETLEIKKYNEANYTLVAYVYIHEDPETISHCLEHSGAIASGATFCQTDPVTRRPTHGIFIWCSRPSESTVEQLTDAFLHEALHIVTGGSFIGSGLPALECTDLTESFPARCEGKTFKFVNQSWADKNGVITTRTTCIAITPNIKKAAQDHFNCSTVEGAEVRVVEDGNGSVCVDQRHWNMRLFSDELVTPHEGANKRLSVFTLAALKDTEWYAVDMGEAEPLVASRPRGLESCDAAAKSCHEILNNNRQSDNELAKLIEPYCDTEQKIISSRCSYDGTTMLGCSLAATGDCHILFVNKEEYGYDSSVCEKATKQSNYDAREMGGNIGKGTMCATFALIANFTSGDAIRNMRDVFPSCLWYKCQVDAVVYVLTPRNRTCQVVCTRSMANQIIAINYSECNRSRIAFSHLICPDFDQVCQPLKASTKASTKITPRSPSQSTSRRGKPDMTSEPSGPATTKPSGPGLSPESTAENVPQLGPTPDSSGIKHDSKCIAFTLLTSVVFAKVWFQIF